MSRKYFLAAGLLLALLLPFSAFARFPANPGNPDAIQGDGGWYFGTGGYTRTQATSSSSDKDVMYRIQEKSAAFSTFLSLVSEAGLENLLKSESPITLLLPTNEAFARMDPEALAALRKDPAKCREFVLALILQGEVTTRAMKAGGQVTTAEGVTLSVDASGETLQVANAKVVLYDIPAKNGVIHVVDSVLAPSLQVALR